MTEDSNIPVFYVDAAVNAKISGETKALAPDLLNMITGRGMPVRASIHNGNPQYLPAARYSVYDAPERHHPIYSAPKKLVSVPGAFVFRIKPDGNAHMDEVLQNADSLPFFRLTHASRCKEIPETGLTRNGFSGISQRHGLRKDTVGILCLFSEITVQNCCGFQGIDVQENSLFLQHRRHFLPQGGSGIKSGNLE